MHPWSLHQLMAVPSGLEEADAYSILVPSLLTLFPDSPLILDGHSCCWSLLGGVGRTTAVFGSSSPDFLKLKSFSSSTLCTSSSCPLPLLAHACHWKRENLWLLFYIRFRKGCFHQAKALSGFLLFINVTISDLKSTFASTLITDATYQLQCHPPPHPLFQRVM